jgi:peptidoglycan hydrolase-like protein with peptidoglycan-binding domain
MATITASVGRGGANRRNDVQVVQSLINQNIGQLVPLAPLRVDGIAGPSTISAIEEFQRRIVKLAMADGRIDPNGPTWQKLNNGQAPGAPKTSDQWSGDSAQWPQDKKLLSMEQIFRGKVQTVLESLRKEGFQPHIVYGWRSVAVQQRLVAEGKSKVRFSFHNGQKPDGTPKAYAADIIDKRWSWEKAAETNGFWDALGKAAKDVGLVWGGDWNDFRDVAHIQGRQNSELATVKRESGL